MEDSNGKHKQKHKQHSGKCTHNLTCGLRKLLEFAVTLVALVMASLMFLSRLRQVDSHSSSFSPSSALEEQYIILPPSADANNDETSLSPAEAYRRKWQEPVEDYVQVFENHLPPESLHQEGGSCRVGTKLYLIGGANSTMHNVVLSRHPELGSQLVTIYDMRDMTVTFGPPIPFRAKHISCAEAPDGFTLHITGGFRQNASRKSKAAHNHHFVLDTRTIEARNATWEKRAVMPHRRGAHGCTFLTDGKMYCVGGGISQAGPFKTEMMIYDPAVDAWSMGPSMSTPRDHIYETVIALHGGRRLYVAGGRSHIKDVGAEKMNPAYSSNTNTVEIFDISTGAWMVMRNLLMVKDAIATTRYYRYGEDKEPNLLLIGGETFIHYAGQAFNVV
jgi:phage terminase large subunit-like protein